MSDDINPFLAQLMADHEETVVSTGSSLVIDLDRLDDDAVTMEELSVAIIEAREEGASQAFENIAAELDTFAEDVKDLHKSKLHKEGFEHAIRCIKEMMSEKRAQLTTVYDKDEKDLKNAIKDLAKTMGVKP